MSCCPDRVGMKRNEAWSYYKTVKNVTVNAGYVTHNLTQDVDVLRITSDVTARTGMPAWAECVNVRKLNNQVVKVDLKIYVRKIDKPMVATIKPNVKKVSVRKKMTFKTFKVIFEDEDGDRSEEVFENISKDQLLEKLNYNLTKFGLRTISVNGKGGIDITDTKAGVAYAV